MFMRTSTKIVLLCLCAAILFGIIVAITYIPRRISQEFSGVTVLMQGEDGMEILQTVDIRIDGRLHLGLFASHPVFRGYFEISDRWYTIGNTTQIHFFNGFGEHDYDRMGAWLVYWTQSRAGPDVLSVFHNVGFIHTDARFSSLVISLPARTEFFSTQIDHATAQTGLQTWHTAIAAPATDIGSVREVLTANDLEWVDNIGVWRSMR